MFKPSMTWNVVKPQQKPDQYSVKTHQDCCQMSESWFLNARLGFKGVFRVSLWTKYDQWYNTKHMVWEMQYLTSFWVSQRRNKTSHQKTCHFQTFWWRKSNKNKSPVHASLCLQLEFPVLYFLHCRTYYFGLRARENVQISSRDTLVKQ